MNALLRGIALACCLVTAAFALDFPQLTGRVVDQAGVMSADSRSAIETKLKDLEDKSGIQLVVATVKSLQGSDIETYANELFRNWKLGQAQKNNGVLLLVAPNEHKVRIEVGCGVEHGVDGIISVLDGDSADWQPQAVQSTIRSDDTPGALAALLPILGFLGVALVLKLIIVGIGETWHRGVSGTWQFAPAGHYVQRGNRRVFVRDRRSSGSSDWSSASSSSSDSSSSSSSDSGFSGDGGSSGGGGASGSW